MVLSEENSGVEYASFNPSWSGGMMGDVESMSEEQRGTKRKRDR